MPRTQGLKTDGLEIMFDKIALDNEDWMRLIEVRQSFIKPHLNNFTLKELGSISCLARESFTHSIAIDGPKLIGNEKFSLKTQGIFHFQQYSKRKIVPNTGGYDTRRDVCYPSDGTIIIWGLTRADQWVTAAVNYIGKDGYKGRGYEKAISVDIQETDLKSLIFITQEEPKKIWKALGESIKEWARAREILYNQALNLVKIIELEETVALFVRTYV